MFQNQNPKLFMDVFITVKLKEFVQLVPPVATMHVVVWIVLCHAMVQHVLLILIVELLTNVIMDVANTALVGGYSIFKLIWFEFDLTLFIDKNSSSTMIKLFFFFNLDQSIIFCQRHSSEIRIMDNSDVESDVLETDQAWTDRPTTKGFNPANQNKNKQQTAKIRILLTISKKLKKKINEKISCQLLLKSIFVLF